MAFVVSVRRQVFGNHVRKGADQIRAHGRYPTGKWPHLGPRLTGDHEFDLLCTNLGIQHRVAPPMRPQTNGMVERFNGRIEDFLQSHRFRSADDLEQTILRYVHLYNSQLPQSALKRRTPVANLKDWKRKRPELFRKRVYNLAGCDI